MKRSRKLKIKVIKKNHTKKKRRRKKKKTKKVYDKDDFRSGDGMLTSVGSKFMALFTYYEFQLSCKAN